MSFVRSFTCSRPADCFTRKKEIVEDATIIGDANCAMWDWSRGSLIEILCVSVEIAHIHSTLFSVSFL